MYSAVKYLGKNRIGVFADLYVENSFIARNSDIVFARVNKINDKWVVWFYTAHLQKTFDKFRDALSCINRTFVRWYREKFL